MSEIINPAFNKCKKVYDQPYSNHDWMPISHQKTNTSEFVTQLMCRACFCEISIAEARASIMPKT